MRLRPLLILLFAWFAAVAVAEPYSRGLLWEISRPGSATSYLFGTMHTADQRLLWLSPAVEQAFSVSPRFALEMLPDELAARRFAEAGQLPEGRRLSALLPASDWARLRARFAARSVGAEWLDRLKPWAALLLLTEAQAESGPDAASGGTGSLDADLYARARRAGKKIDELDHVEEQIAVFDALPEASALALLIAALDRHERLRAEHEQSVAAYRRGDLKRLMQLARGSGNVTVGPAEQPHLALLEQRIVRDRSVVMAYRLQSVMRHGPTFAAVGALHLYGRHGMLKLLRDDGWTVRRRD